MKKIIAAIDFSRCSLHALEYAIHMANHVEADVIMVWVDNIDNSDQEMFVQQREHRHEMKKQFDEVIKHYQPLLKRGELSFKLRKGKVYREIANQAKYDDASMIIAGSHGVSGYEKFWIGSNANRIVSYAPCPVITIRLDFNYKDRVTRIVLPIDSTLETRQKVPFTVRIAKLFQSEIHILAVYSTSVQSVQRKVDSYVQQTALFIRKHDVPFVVEAVQADNITSSVIHYAETVDADLIAIMTEQETTAANILLGPYAQQMVNNSPIPVLTMQAMEIMKIHAGM